MLSTFCTLTPSSLKVSYPELKTHRSLSSAKISAASDNTVLNTGVEICVVRFLLCRHLTKNMDVIIHNTSTALLP